MRPAPVSGGTTHHGRQAIVVGASMAGLLAARALSEHFGHVLVLDKDDLAGPERARKAVPQGNHIHVIWSGGAAAIERFFPGLWTEMLELGAIAFDNSLDMRWFQRGVWKLRVPSGLIMYAQSRPLLEHRIRSRLLALANVEVRSGQAVEELVWDEPAGRVCGVRTIASGRAACDLAADFVVDATGRSTRSSDWLERHGFDRPRESAVAIDLRYASRVYAIPDDQPRDWRVLAIYGGPPDSRRAGVIFPIEGGRWIVTLSGCLGDHPPGDEAGFLEFARGLDRIELHDAIVGAKPLSPISVFGFPVESRRHFEGLPRVPGGWVVMGDAACAFNPFYGQGVTVCALEAEALGRCLADTSPGNGESLQGVPRAYYGAAAQVVSRAWLLATATDLLFPQAVGPRPPGLGLFGWYSKQLLEASSTDEAVLRRFLEVLHFLEPPAALFTPSMLLRACRWAFGRR